MQTQTITIQCEDAPGIIHRITGILYHSSLNIVSNSEFVDHDTNTFFMRTEFEGSFTPSALRMDLQKALPQGAILNFPPARKKVLVLVTKEPYCLADILVRTQFGEWPIDVVGVIGNHSELEALVSPYALPFHTVSHVGLDRQEHEQKLLECIEKFSFDYLVLAKYMRILSPRLVERFPNKIINIHHSFLPAFVGAKPYNQAYERGVKIIGATSHFVTNDLDEGPIICQDVVAINHTMTPADLVRAGRDVEKIVLSRALRLVVEDRVYIIGRKTVLL